MAVNNGWFEVRELHESYGSSAPEKPQDVEVDADGRQDQDDPGRAVSADALAAEAEDTEAELASPPARIAHYDAEISQHGVEAEPDDLPATEEAADQPTDEVEAATEADDPVNDDVYVTKEADEVATDAVETTEEQADVETAQEEAEADDAQVEQDEPPKADAFHVAPLQSWVLDYLARGEQVLMVTPKPRTVDELLALGIAESPNADWARGAETEELLREILADEGTPANGDEVEERDIVENDEEPEQADEAEDRAETEQEVTQDDPVEDEDEVVIEDEVEDDDHGLEDEEDL